MVTRYVGSAGSDANTGLTESDPLATFTRAAALSAVSGDSICFLPGVHKMQNYAFKSGSYNCKAILYDQGKNLSVYARNPPGTVLDCTGADLNGSYNAYIWLKSVTGASYRNLHFKGMAAPAGNTTPCCWYEDYSLTASALPLTIQNCVFDMYSVVSPSYKFNFCRGDDALRHKIYNNIIRMQTVPSNDYKGNSDYINNLYGTLPSLGTKAYGVVRAWNGDDLLGPADDCRHLGDPAILNADGTRSHIGIFGGPYGYLWNRASYLVAMAGSGEVFTLTESGFAGIGKTSRELVPEDFLTFGVPAESLTKSVLEPVFGSHFSILKAIANAPMNTLDLAVRPCPQIVRPISSIDLSLASTVRKITADDTAGIYRLFSVDGVTWETFDASGARQTVSLTGDVGADVDLIRTHGMLPARLAAVTNEQWNEVLPPDLQDKAIRFLMLLSGEERTKSLTVLQDRYGYYQAMLPADYTVRQHVSRLAVTFNRAVQTEAKITYAL